MNDNSDMIIIQRLKSYFHLYGTSDEETFRGKRQYLTTYIHEISLEETLKLIKSAYEVLFHRRLEIDRSNKFTPFPHFDPGFHELMIREKYEIFAVVNVVSKNVLRFFHECMESDKHLFGPILKEYFEMQNEQSKITKMFLTKGLGEHGVGILETDLAFDCAHLLESYKVASTSAVTKILKIRQLINPVGSNKNEITQHLHDLVILLFDITSKFFGAYKQLTCKTPLARNGKIILIDPRDTWKLISHLIQLPQEIPQPSPPIVSPVRVVSSPVVRNVPPSMFLLRVPLYTQNHSKSSYVLMDNNNTTNRLSISMPIQSRHPAPSPTQFTYLAPNQGSNQFFYNPISLRPTFHQTFSSVVTSNQSPRSNEEPRGEMFVDWKSIREDRIIFDNFNNCWPTTEEFFPISFPISKGLPSLPHRECQVDDPRSSPPVSTSPGLLDEYLH